MVQQLPAIIVIAPLVTSFFIFIARSYQCKRVYMSQTEFLGVKQASARTGLGEHTLRYYEKIGLIGPVRRSVSGRRLYSEEDLKWIDFLKCLRSTGMSIEHMIEYANCLQEGDENYDRRLNLMREHRSVILGKMEELQRYLSAIEWKIDYYAKQKENLKNEKNA